MDSTSMPTHSHPDAALNVTIPTGDERDVHHDTATGKNKRTEEAEEQPVSKKLKEDNADSEKHAPDDHDTATGGNKRTEEAEEQPVPRVVVHGKKTIIGHAAPKKFDKKLKSVWKLSSDDTDHAEPLDDEVVLANITNKSLTDIFSQNHDNLITVVMFMMENGMKLAVSGAFMDPEEAYIKNGKYDYEKITDMKMVPMMFLTAVGSIEKVLIPGLQIIYSLGFHKRKHEGDDYTMYSSKSDITLFYKFNDRDCKLKIVGTPSGGRFDNVDMIMYVED